jgi:NADPH-dependent F420 reductase
MRIALLGGTGDIGEGLALRWGRDSDHDIVIGSRDPEKARDAADDYEAELAAYDGETKITGFENGMAADRADVVVLAVPPYHVADTVEHVADSLGDDDIIVSPATGMQRDEDGFHYHRPEAGSVTAIAADAAPDTVPVVGAFHNLAAGRLSNLDVDLGIDTLVVGEDADAKATVSGLAEDIDGLRALDAGGIANAAEIESVTPLLINIGMNNDGLDDLGVSLVGVEGIALLVGQFDCPQGGGLDVVDRCFRVAVSGRFCVAVGCVGSRRVAPAASVISGVSIASEPSLQVRYKSHLVIDSCTAGDKSRSEATDIGTTQPK